MDEIFTDFESALDFLESHQPAEPSPTQREPERCEECGLEDHAATCIHRLRREALDTLAASEMADGTYELIPATQREEASRGHVYTSTACQHELHERCRKTCKFCATPCLCKCHRRGDSK